MAPVIAALLRAASAGGLASAAAVAVIVAAHYQYRSYVFLQLSPAYYDNNAAYYVIVARHRRVSTGLLKCFCSSGERNIFHGNNDIKKKRRPPHRRKIVVGVSGDNSMRRPSTAAWRAARPSVSGDIWRAICGLSLPPKHHRKAHRHGDKPAHREQSFACADSWRHAIIANKHHAIASIS